MGIRAACQGSPNDLRTVVSGHFGTVGPGYWWFFTIGGGRGIWSAVFAGGFSGRQWREEFGAEFF